MCGELTPMLFELGECRLLGDGFHDGHPRQDAPAAEKSSVEGQ
jgi:hypothetical protein